MTRAQVESLDREGRGVAHVEGKTVFIDGALAGEIVEFVPYQRKPSFDLAQLVDVRRASGSRVVPRCAHFGVCGGCSLQHADQPTQVAAKQRVLEDALWHIGRVRADALMPPIHGIAWRYRQRARFSARMVEKKGGVLVGFRERKSSFVADMVGCEVLPAQVACMLPRLRELIGTLSVRARLPQIEVAVGDSDTALVLRILDPLTTRDEGALRLYAEKERVQIWLQPGGPVSVELFWPRPAPQLYYSLPEFDVRIAFAPVDFTQVNHAVNRMLVRRVVGLLEPMPGERIADFFCGLGNFSLPLARAGARVLGVEGSVSLVRSADANAELNRLAGQCDFQVANLFDPRAIAALPGTDKALLDPPREGAIELIKSFSRRGPRRLVYVSCDPATLARDAGALVNAHGYTLAAAGIANMFPHTSHVESIALFERA
jgi:23S rRNA (uracil1939-C5)-methyltransferase